MNSSTQQKQGIPSLAYLILGIVVAVASYLIDQKKLVLFMIIGAVFVMIGVVKLVFARERKAEKTIIDAQKPHMKYKYCARCGNRMQMQERFCRNCGTQSIVPGHGAKYSPIRMGRYYG